RGESDVHLFKNPVSFNQIHRDTHREEAKRRHQSDRRDDPGPHRPEDPAPRRGTGSGVAHVSSIPFVPQSGAVNKRDLIHPGRSKWWNRTMTTADRPRDELLLREALDVQHDRVKLRSREPLGNGSVAG